MKKLIILFLAFFLYSCSSFHNSASDKYNILKLRVSKLEGTVEQNGAAIRNNTERINNLDERLLLIRKRLEAQRENDNFINKIPPVSEIDGNDNKTQKKVVSAAANDNTTADNSQADNKTQTADNITLSKNEPQQNIMTDNYKAYYKKALKTYMNGNYRLSVNMFKTFLSVYKDNNLDDNAIYWLAHSYLHLGDNKNAVKYLKRLIEQYPYNSIISGGKTDAALYDLIKIYRYDKKKASYYRNILTRSFPNSKYAVLAKHVRRTK